jgi:SAM-dependent methyltransferase
MLDSPAGAGHVCQLSVGVRFGPTAPLPSRGPWPYVDRMQGTERTRGIEKVSGTYDYARLDASGEGERAAARMEARAVEPASQELFEALVAPHLEPSPRAVLELGAGPGALARRIVAAGPTMRVIATDKSETMLGVAARLAALAPGRERLGFVRWDVEDPVPAGLEGPFDLVVSSVMVPYLDDATLAALLTKLRAVLAPGGRLLFVEQDLQTVSLHHERYSEVRELFVRTGERSLAFVPLRLRRLMREAGYRPLPVRSHLWQSTVFGPYLRDLVSRAADEAVAAGRLDEGRVMALVADLERESATGDFLYGLVYHAMAAELA